MDRRRGIMVGLIVGLVVSSGVAASSQTPVWAFVLSMICVLIAVGLVWLVSGGVARR